MWSIGCVWGTCGRISRTPGDFYEQTMWDGARAFTLEEFTNHMKVLEGVSQAAYDCPEKRDRYV